MDETELSFLLVEPNARDALFVVTYLAEEQADVTLGVDRAATAEEARLRLASKPYDLVLLAAATGRERAPAPEEDPRPRAPAARPPPRATPTRRSPWTREGRRTRPTSS